MPLNDLLMAKVGFRASPWHGTEEQFHTIPNIQLYPIIHKKKHAQYNGKSAKLDPGIPAGLQRFHPSTSRTDPITQRRYDFRQRTSVELLDPS